MWWLIPFVVIIGILLYEIRVRRPDQIVLFEKAGRVQMRKGRFYPRHLSLSIPATIHSTEVEVPARAKGKLDLRIRLSITVAATQEHLSKLIRVGGWSGDAVSRATQELAGIIRGMVGEYTETREVEDVTCEKLAESLRKRLPEVTENMGLTLLSVNVHEAEPTDHDIVEAIRQREAARIREQTEQANQQARVAEAQARIRADEQIAESEHKLALKRLELRRKQEESEAQLARARVEEEIKRRRLNLQVDREELEILANNPSLLMLTPQLAKLAEASQSLRNARTVISLSQGQESPNILTLLTQLLQNTGSSGNKKA